MDENHPSQRQYDADGRPVQPGFGQKIKKLLAPIGAVLLVGLKFLGSLKLLLPVLKTGGSMIVVIWIYTYRWGWQFAVGFVVLIFIHECGHLIAAKRHGLKVGAPVFIPFMGAFIALKEAPRNAWIEAEVGIGGPMLGTVGAIGCELIYVSTGNLMFRSLAYTGFFLNLFNLAPTGFLDGGRIVSAITPWLWLVGFPLMVVWLFLHFNPVVLLIVIFSVPRLLSLFRRKTEAELRYFEVTPAQRWSMAAMYFGLIAFLALAMEYTFIPS